MLTEHQEQCLLVGWSNYQEWKDVFFAIPNGGSRHKLEARNLKKEGVKAGIPDLMLAVPNYIFHGLFIEMKRTDGGRTSPAQIARITKLRERGYNVTVCHGFEHAKSIIEEYLCMDKRELANLTANLSDEFKRLQSTIHGVVECKKDSASRLAVKDAENSCNTLIQEIIKVMGVLASKSL
jgi:hypothetical protein